MLKSYMDIYGPAWAHIMLMGKPIAIYVNIYGKGIDGPSGQNCHIL
jgi:hypothetical protein